jgi:hypothetical protein
MPDVDLLTRALVEAAQDHIGTMVEGVDLPSLMKNVSATVLEGLQEAATMVAGR